MKRTKKNDKKKEVFKIYISSAAGLDYTGITVFDEKEAKELCNKYNEQDGHNPYCQHVYKKQ